MRHSNTGKSDPQPAPGKRGFFAAAGERLKRAMSGARGQTETEAETAAAASLPEPTTLATETAPGTETIESEVTTSVQAKARELLQQDRSTKRGRAPVATEAKDATNGEARPRNRKTSPPPLPWQRTAADANLTEPAPSAEPTAIATQPADTAPSAEPTGASAPHAAPKRPVRDSKSEALRARLGAAKAALAQAQAMRVAHVEVEVEPVAQVQEAQASAVATAPLSENTQPEVAMAPWRDGGTAAEPIRTLTIARVLARQGYYDRSLNIYESLLAENAADAELRAEANRVRAQKASDS